MGAPITVELSDEAVDALREIAASKGLELEDALKYALANGRLIAKETSSGSKILIEKPDRSLKELIGA